MSDNICNFEDCNKKLGLIKIKCKCGNYYCPIHRHSTIHNCKYDYIDEAKNRLAKENIRVVTDKIIKI